MRTNWMVHLLTNWMGDDAWISSLSARAAPFQLHRRHPVDARPVETVHSERVPPSVDVTVEGVNQRNETTCTGRATVLVSTAGGSPPPLPELSACDFRDPL